MTSIGGLYGLHIDGTARQVLLPNLAHFVPPGGIFLFSSRMTSFKLPAFAGGNLSRLYVNFRDDVQCEFELAQPPSWIGHPYYDTSGDGGVYFDVSDTFNATWPLMRTTGGQVVLARAGAVDFPAVTKAQRLQLRRVRNVNLPALTNVGIEGIDIQSVTYVGALELPKVVGTAGMPVHIEVGEQCTAVKVGHAGGGVVMADLSQLSVVKTGAGGPMEIDIGGAAGGPEAVVGDFEFACVGGCVIGSAIGGLSRLQRVGKAAGAWAYRLEGISVGSAAELMAKNMTTVELGGGPMALTIRRTSGATSFVAGRSSSVVAGGPLVVRDNSGLTKQCPIVGVNFASVTIQNNPMLRPTCESGHGVPCGSCSGNTGGAGACGC